VLKTDLLEPWIIFELIVRLQFSSWAISEQVKAKFAITKKQYFKPVLYINFDDRLLKDVLKQQSIDFLHNIICNIHFIFQFVFFFHAGAMQNSNLISIYAKAGIRIS